MPFKSRLIHVCCASVIVVLELWLLLLLVLGDGRESSVWMGQDSWLGFSKSDLLKFNIRNPALTNKRALATVGDALKF